ncbi:BTAD domain-containing putative transcriptional regulator [Streptosporangium sp. DT93]|uniref:AfsR/SARP family transcriptional regulator n=1 Tax=Streptosporangium sp. DT93 TaxID=3393428 RepID=UPI003CE775D5
MTIRLLGPLDVVLGDTPRYVSGLRRKTVLAALALRVGEVISSDRLIDVVWDGRSPATAVNTLQSHISHLRGLLGARESIVTRPSGYCLVGENVVTDAQIIERLIGQAKQATDPGERSAHLKTALSMWRGRPLGDLSPHPWLDEQAERLERVRLVAVNMFIDVQLALGEHAGLIPEMEDLTHQHPFDEDLHRKLILALYRTGRQADALLVLHRLRLRLKEELGIVPGRPLQVLEEAILRHDASIDPPVAVGTAGRAASPAPRHPTPIVPAQLPPRGGRIIGRLTELGRLDRALTRGGGAGAGSPATILAIVGAPGAGKTALAVHWAQRVAGRFPDGQLYVDLRGFAPSGPAVATEDALRGLLDALAVPPDGIPAGLEARAGLYRSLLAGKRILVVLDNARDAAQVRALLPGSPGCVALVTSRTQMTSLVVTEGAQQLSLDLLARSEARALLASRLGEERVNAETGPAEAIVEWCGGLPLALAIAAARAAAYPSRPLSRLAAEIHGDRPPLDVLTCGDPTADLRAAFSWSYRSLSADAADLFRWLGSRSDHDVTVETAAESTGLRVHHTRSLIDELAGAHLLTRRPGDRYALPGLLRAYAMELWLRR